MSRTRPSNIVLVHGGFVDGSGWEGVYRALRKRGHRVSIVQNPTVSLAGDMAATKLVLDAQDGPVVLVGHSYGGVVVTEAGNDPRVVALVYIAAFAPDAGESVSSLIKGDRRTIGGRNILDQERFKLKQPKVGYPAYFSASALSQIEAKLLLAGI